MKEKISDILHGQNFISQFIKFGLVGVSNTLISYAIQIICYYILFRNASFEGLITFLSHLHISTTAETLRIVITTMIAFIAGVTNSFYWNSKYVFNSGEKKTNGAKTYLKTIICYGLTGLIISPALKVYLAKFGIPFWLSTIISLAVTIPLNFLLNKFWTYNSKNNGQI